MNQHQKYRLVYESAQWPDIKKALQKISNQKITKYDLINQLIKFNNYTSNKKYEASFAQLKTLDQTKLVELYSRIANFILENQKTYSIRGIPVFKKGINMTHIFTKKDLIILLCLMATCLTITNEGNFNNCTNFSYILSEDFVKVRPVFKYLSDILTKQNISHQQQVKIIRKKIDCLSLSELKQSKQPLIKIQLTGDNDSIQNYVGSIKIDFANKYIGGGALLKGKVQQEIMFINRPQLYTTMLLCEVMQDNESIALVGFKKYYKTKGYSKTVEFDGNQNLEYNFDKDNIANQYIVAIDALRYPQQQFTPPPILRQINKSYAGFSMLKQSDEIVTGNWGCGAFGGDVQLKFIIQWISASLAKKKLIYCPFGNQGLAYAQQIINLYKGYSVGELSKILFELYRNGGLTVFKFLSEQY